MRQVGQDLLNDKSVYTIFALLPVTFSQVQMTSLTEKPFQLLTKNPGDYSAKTKE